MSCGSEKVVLLVPEGRAQVLAPKPLRTSDDALGEFRKALENPIGPRLRDIAKDKRAILLVQDQTRSILEKRELAEAIFEELSKGAPSSLHVLIATGSHSPNDQKNMAIMEMMAGIAESNGLSCVFEEHDGEHGREPKDYESHIFIGKTALGTPLYIHRKHMESEVIIGIESMKMHYFAGYSNMLKLLALPGPAAYETIRVNHRLILNPLASACSHPLHHSGSNRNNPVSNDMYEAYKLAISQKLVDGKLLKLKTPKPAFVLASVTEPKSGAIGIVWCRAGEAEAVTREGIRSIDENYALKAEPADIVIAGAGPSPHDRHLFYVHNGADTARRGLKKGGSMLVIAECPEGIGPAGQQTTEFVEAVKRPKGDILQYVRDNFEVGMQKSYKLGELLHEAGEVCFYIAPKSGLSENELSALHLSSTRDPQKWLDEKLKQKPDASVLIITREATRIAIT